MAVSVTYGINKESTNYSRTTPCNDTMLYTVNLCVPCINVNPNFAAGYISSFSVINHERRSGY